MGGVLCGVVEAGGRPPRAACAASALAVLSTPCSFARTAPVGPSVDCSGAADCSGATGRIAVGQVGEGGSEVPPAVDAELGVDVLHLVGYGDHREEEVLGDQLAGLALR